MATENRERVLRAATEAFLAHGYGSSVEAIARRAHVAKQTVYHHFPSKGELFKEVARGLARSVLVELDAGPAGLRAALERFAASYRSRALGAEGIAVFRTVAAEMPRFRSLARSMYEASAGEMVRQIARFLERSMRAGELRHDDPQFAAELLLGMLVGQDRMKRLFGVERPNGPGDAADRARSAHIVDCFLRAYRP